MSRISLSKRNLFELLVAVLFVHAVHLIVNIFGDYGAKDSSLLLSIFAVVLSTWYGGFNSGMIAVVLATFMNTYYFLTPNNSLAVQNAEDIWRLLTFTIVATLVSLLISERKNLKKRSEEEKNGSV